MTAPVVSFSNRQNIVLTDGGLVTVSGVNFRTSDLTTTVDLGLLSCMTTSWASKSSVACIAYVSSNTGDSKDIAVTASAIVGTRTHSFTFDGELQFVAETRSHDVQCA